MRTSKWILCGCLAAGMPACNTDFAPATLVNQLRVLAVRASPPELNPGQVATLDSLVVGQADPNQPVTVLYVGCDPDPAGLAPNPCTQYQNLQDASELFQDGGSADGGLSLVIPGAQFLGINRAQYGVPSTFFDSVPSSSMAPTSGVLAVILALAIAEPLPDPPTPAALQALLGRVASRQTPSVLSIARLRVSTDSTNDQNPQLEGIFTATDPLEPGHGLRVAPGNRVPLIAAENPKPSSTYVSYGPDGSQETLTEDDEVSWFSTVGSFDDPRTELDQVPPAAQGFGAPSGEGSSPTDALSTDRTFTLWAVLRDGRGGVDWMSAQGFVCDPSLPTPSVSATALVAGDTLLIQGANLDAVLDQTLGGVPLLGGLSDGAIAARLPSGDLTSGLLDLRGKNCGDATAAITW